MKHTIFISHYNSTAYKQFVQHFSDYNLHIWNKSGTELDLKVDYEKSVENIGRETHSYLDYIIDQYDNLSPVTILIQDDTDNHIRDVEHFKDYLDRFIHSDKLFDIYPAHFRPHNPTRPQRIVKNGIVPPDLPHVPSHYNKTIIKDIAKKFDIDVPVKYTTNCCAFLLCKKECIHKRPRAFYEKLLAFYMDDNDIASTKVKGYIFEHMWQIIFSGS